MKTLLWFRGEPKPWRVYDVLPNGDEIPTGHEFDEDDQDSALALMGNEHDGRIIGRITARPGQFVKKAREMLGDQP